MITYFTYAARQQIAKTLPGKWGFSMNGFHFEGKPKSDEEVMVLILHRHKTLQVDFEHIDFLMAQVKANLALR